MSFYENLERVCKEKGTSPHALVTKKLGTSSSTLTYWRNGNTPTLKIIEKIADALGVESSELLATDADKKKSEDQARAALFGDSAAVTDEQWAEIKKFAEFIKQRDAAKK